MNLFHVSDRAGPEHAAERVHAAMIDDRVAIRVSVVDLFQEIVVAAKPDVFFPTSYTSDAILLSKTMRAWGRFERSTVVRVMALGLSISVLPASVNQLANCVSGSDSIMRVTPSCYSLVGCQLSSFLKTVLLSFLAMKRKRAHCADCSK